MKFISLVIPIFNEEKNIYPLYKRLRRVARFLESYGFEFIFVNDGSLDKSMRELERIAREDRRVKVLEFSKNFGKESAISAGCRFAKGDAVVTMDGDLQHPPQLIPKLISKWRKGVEVVYTVRKENKGASFMKRTTSNLYWWLFKKAALSNTEAHSTDFRLLDRKVVDTFNRFSERGRLYRGIIDWMGYKRARVDFVAPRRRSGKPAYSYRKLLGLALNSFTAFSLFPLRAAGYLGILITFFSSLLIIAMLITRWFIDPVFFSSLAILAVMNILLIGIVLVSLGLIALYIARINNEVIDRPLYIVKEMINMRNKEDE